MQTTIYNEEILVISGVELGAISNISIQPSAFVSTQITNKENKEIIVKAQGGELVNTRYFISGIRDPSQIICVDSTIHNERGSEKVGWDWHMFQHFNSYTSKLAHLTDHDSTQSMRKLPGKSGVEFEEMSQVSHPMHSILPKSLCESSTTLNKRASEKVGGDVVQKALMVC